ncbi:hypothetical protein ACT7CW_20430 [Bacillus pacificus]
MRIKKQLSLLAVIFVFSIIFSIIFVNPAYAAQNGFINFENGKEFTSNSSVQLFALVTLYHYLHLSFYYLHILLIL